MLLLYRSTCQEVLACAELLLTHLDPWGRPKPDPVRAAIDRLRDCLLEAQAPPTEREQAFYGAAYEEYHEDGRLEIEEDVTVRDLPQTPGSYPPEGSYVLAWVFVKRTLALSPEEAARESEPALVLHARQRGVTPVHLAVARAIDPHRIVEGTLEEVIHLCHAQGDDPIVVFEAIDEWGEKIRGEKERTERDIRSAGTGDRGDPPPPDPLEWGATSGL